MSIHAELALHEAAGRLVRVCHALGATEQRALYLSPTVAAWIDGPWSSREWEKRGGQLGADLDHFVAGDLITASLTAADATTAYMARLDPPSDAVWEIRSRDPKPGIRVLGGFADTDTFVGLVCKTRSPLGHKDSDAWTRAINECKAEWRNLFPAYNRLTGEHVHDFISTNVFVN